ncbi:hypothetical protein Tco_1354760 [Tanacetum coccineum]
MGCHPAGKEKFFKGREALVLGKIPVLFKICADQVIRRLLFLAKQALEHPHGLPRWFPPVGHPVLTTQQGKSLRFRILFGPQSTKMPMSSLVKSLSSGGIDFMVAFPIQRQQIHPRWPLIIYAKMGLKQKHSPPMTPESVCKFLISLRPIRCALVQSKWIAESHFAMGPFAKGHGGALLILGVTPRLSTRIIHKQSGQS